MTTTTWIGGGNNEASNSADWTNGVPLAGETMLMTAGPQGAKFIMNVQGNQLAGDAVSSAGCALTINASRNAVVHSTVGYRSDVTFDLTQQSSLALTANYMGEATVNITGIDTLVVNGTGGGCPVINLAARSEWIGTFSLDAAKITGGIGATFDNDGASFVLDGGPGPGNVVIPVAVVGTGSFTVEPGIALGSYTYPTRLEFVKAVGAGQTVTDDGMLVIDQPGQFLASVTLAQGTVPYGAAMPAEIDLAGLLNVTGYSFGNDVLSLFAGAQVVDTLRLADRTPFGFEVERTAVGVGVVAYADASRTPVGMPLAMHTV